jgi:hypothetical protein
VRRAKVALVHVPRTGGTALGSLIHHQTLADPDFYFSFFGLDSSRGANRIVVERLRRGDEDYHRLIANRHFLDSHVVMGHFSTDLAELLADLDLDLQFAAVVREPVGRVISLVHQYSVDAGEASRFGDVPVPSKSRATEDYWRAIARILSSHRGGPIPGLLPHESMMLSNGMCHMIGGSPLHTYSPRIGLDRALGRLPSFKLALFERFNETCGALLRDLAIPVRLDAGTNYVGEENPTDRTGHSQHYGAPPEVLDLVGSLNEDDLTLYRAVVEGRLYCR